MLSEYMDSMNEMSISNDDVGLANQQSHCANSTRDINEQNVINSHSNIKSIGSGFIHPINEQFQLQRQSQLQVQNNFDEIYIGDEYNKYLSQNHLFMSVSEKSPVVILGDTGASSCMFPMEEVFINMIYYSTPQPRVYFGDKRSVPIIGYGIVYLNLRLVLSQYHIMMRWDL